MSTSYELDEEVQLERLDLRTVALFRRRLWPYMRRYRGQFAASTFFVMLSTVAAMATPWIVGHAVDHVLVPRRTDLLVPYALLFFGTDFIRAASMILQNYLVTGFGQRVLHDLRQDLLRQYQFYPLAEFNRTPTGRLVTRLVNDTSSLQDLFTGGFAVALGEVAIVLGIMVWLVVLSPKLGLECICVYPLLGWSTRYFSRRIRSTYRRSRAALSRLNAFLAENISGMWLIQVFNKQGSFRKRFDATSRGYTQTQIDTVRTFALFQPTITILASLSMSVLIWYGGWLSLSGSVTLGLLVTFMSYIQGLFAPIRDITEKYNLFVSAMTACERIFEFMDRPREPGTDASVEFVPRLATRGRIEFRDVWFRYEESGPWILKGLSFVIEPGERIGIVGHTGAGKTTLSALLMRFYDIEKGEILLDGVDIRKTDKRALRQAYGYIQQEPFLFSGTIEQNILLWNEERRAAMLKLPSFPGLELAKTVYEKGSNLSAGERQVISFLRALSLEPAILILDEATAHVDSLTEQWIARVSAGAFEERTVLIIAHRLATLRQVDRILVLHHGELVEEGSHRALIEKRGIYQKLYEIQTRKDELGISGQ